MKHCQLMKYYICDSHNIGSTVSVPTFQRNVGPLVTIGAESLDVFLHFFPPHLSRIAQETNRYAKTCREANISEDEDPPAPWSTDEEELKAFIGFTMLMGINRLPSLYDYWSMNPALHYFPIASRISRHRFFELKRYLHFVDNDTLVRRGEEGYSRLQKIQPVLDVVRQTCRQNYAPNQANSIDEAMIKFKGR